MSIYINKDTGSSPGHHRQDRSVPHAGLPGLCQRQELLRGGREPQEGRREVLRHPHLRLVKEAKRKTGANVSVIYVPPAGAADAIWEAVEADLDLVICITEGIPCATC